MRRGNSLLIVLVLVGIVAASVGGYFYRSLKPVITENTPTTKNHLLPMSTPNNENLTPEEANKMPPLPGQTANWKTYRDGKNRFEIQYPGDLPSGTCPNNSAGLSCANGAKVFIGSLGLNIITNSDPDVDKNAVRLFFNGYFQGTKTRQSGFEDCLTNNVKNSSAEISYVYCPNRLIFTAQIKGSSLEIYVLGSNWSGSLPAGFTSQNQIIQILSTFRFL